MNQWQMELAFAREGYHDCFLLAGRYTLLDQTALPEFLPYCVEHRHQRGRGRPVQQRDPRRRPASGGDVQLPGGAAGDDGQGGAHRRGLRAPPGAR